MPRKESTVGVSSAQAQQDAILETEGIESYELPRALIIRIAKSVLQDNVKLQKETVIALVKAATVFINYVVSGYDVTHSRSHKTIAASDVLTALSQLGFKAMVPQLNEELAQYRAIVKSAKSGKGQAPAAQTAPRAPSSSYYNATTVAPHELEAHQWLPQQVDGVPSYEDGYPEEEDGEDFDDEADETLGPEEEYQAADDDAAEAGQIDNDDDDDEEEMEQDDE